MTTDTFKLSGISLSEPFNYKVRQDRYSLIRTLMSEHDRIIQTHGMSNTTTALEQIITFIRRNPQLYVAFARYDKSKVSYAQIPEHIYDVDKRVKTTFQRFVRRQVQVSPDLLRDNMLDDLTSRMLPLTFTGIRIVKGDDIVQAYKDKVGFQSCMTGECAKFTELYAINPDKVTMAIYGERDARALIFKCDDGTLVMDRVYPNKSRWSYVLRQWATKRRIVYRVHDEANDSPLSDGKVHTITLKCKGVFPYADTFRYGKDVDSDTIVLSNSTKSYSYVLTSQEGGLAQGRSVTQAHVSHVCCSCGHHLEDDEIMREDSTSDAYCADCWSEEHGTCCDCGRNTHRDDLYYIEATEEYVCQRCYDRNYGTCDRDGNAYPHDDLNEILSTGTYYCNDCIEEYCDVCTECDQHDIRDRGTYTHDGDFYCRYHAEEYLRKCEECDEVFHVDDMIETDDGYLCSECAGDAYEECCDCGKLKAIEDGLKTHDERFFCDDCKDNLTRCYNCGEWFDDDNDTIITTHDTRLPYCEECRDTFVSEGKLIVCQCGNYLTKLNNNIKKECNDVVTSDNNQQNN